MLAKQSDTLQAVSDLCVRQAVSPVWRSLLNKGSNLGFVPLFATAGVKADEILGKLMETEAWVTLGTVKARGEMGLIQENTHAPTPTAHIGCLLPALAALPTCPLPLPRTKGAREFPGCQPAMSHRTHPFFSTVWARCPTPLSPHSSLPHPTDLPLSRGLSALALAETQRCCGSARGRCWWASTLGSIQLAQHLLVGCQAGAEAPRCQTLDGGCGSTQVWGALPCPQFPIPTSPGLVWPPGQLVQEIKLAEN